MCMITFLNPGVQPDINALLNGAVINDDGHGYAIAAGDDMIIRHGMDIDLIAQFAEDRARYPDGPALFHSRWATHGSRSVDNCHPFEVGRDPRTVVAHNGVLPVTPPRTDWRSDTKYAADVIIPKRFGSLKYRKARKRVEKWMGWGNKLVVITVDRSFRDKSFILNEEAGVWEDGIWYSNTQYRATTAYNYSYFRGTKHGYGDGSASWYADYISDTPSTVIGKELALIEPYNKCMSCGAIVDEEDWDCLYCDKCTRCGMAFYECYCRPIKTVKVPRRWLVS